MTTHSAHSGHLGQRSRRSSHCHVVVAQHICFRRCSAGAAGLQAGRPTLTLPSTIHGAGARRRNTSWNASLAQEAFARRRRTDVCHLPKAPRTGRSKPCTFQPQAQTVQNRSRSTNSRSLITTTAPDCSGQVECPCRAPDMQDQVLATVRMAAFPFIR
jgi:hypothetical protein